MTFRSLLRLMCGCLLIALTTTTAARAQGGGSSTATGISRLMNPSLSVNGLLLGQISRDNPDRAANQVGLQEMEMRFTSVIDPFWTADMILSLHSEIDPLSHRPGTVMEVEKAMAEYRNMPRGLGLRVGKDHLPFGKQNLLHTHAQAFVKAPVGITAFLGEEILAATGLELTWNVPLPWWSELKTYATSAVGEIFDPDNRDLAYGMRWDNLWDSSDFSTVELGLSALTGPGAARATLSAGRWNMYGADVTWKWVSATSSGGPAVNFVNEVLWPDPEFNVGQPVGFYSDLQYRFARQWWLGLSGSVARDALIAGMPDNSLRTVRETKANLTLTPSEFSSIRLEGYYTTEAGTGVHDLGAYIQISFTMGSHPAHAY